MKEITKLFLPMLMALFNLISCGTPVDRKSVDPETDRYNAIYSGSPWIDDRGIEVSAHGAGVIKENGRYYLFGEKKSDTSNAFTGFNSYSSTDLFNWKFEGVALKVQDSGRLGPDRVGERVKVMKSPATGEYVMFMHTDDMGYYDPAVGYATSDSITGPYEFQGPLLFNGKPIRKWDMGTFQDSDGTGYVVMHGGDIYKLNEDFKSISKQILKDMCSGCESPAIFKKDGIYFFLGSHLTSWERNDNSYYTATSLEGPWEEQGNFAPEATLTWNSQTTFVLPIEGKRDTTYVFMGDRWAYPRQHSAATYVWQPLTASGASLSIPEFLEAWKVNTTTGVASEIEIEGEVIENTDRRITYSGEWEHSDKENAQTSESRSDVPGASFSVSFVGSQIGLFGISRPDSGYAEIIIENDDGKVVLSSVIDMYSKYPHSSLKYISPKLEKNNYVLTFSVIGAHGNWTDKAGTIFGSNGDFVSVNKVVVRQDDPDALEDN